MAREKKNSFFGGMATMAAALALVKVMGAIYKIPIVNMLGKVGYANFTDAYYIYGILLTVSTAGLPAALSKMVAANHVVGQERQVQKIFRTSLAVFLALGTVSFLVMFLGADALAGGIMHNPYAASCIRALAPAMVFVSGVSSFRGYFQGHSNMNPSAVSQIIEAGGKLIILLIAWLWMGGTCTADFAIFGVTLGAALSFGYMIARYCHTKYPVAGDQQVTSTASVLRELLTIAVPITLTASAVSIINFIDSIIVKWRLQEGLGMTVEDSLGLYGTYSGVMNVYNLPASLIMAVTVSVIPAVAGALSAGKPKEASKLVKASYHMTAMLVFPMGVGISVMAKPIVRLLFPRLDADLAGLLLSILGIASIFVCLVSVSHSILQAHGRQNLPVLIMLGAGTAMIVIDYTLVGIPAINIFGSPTGTLCCFVLASVADFICVGRIVPNPPNYLRLFFGPGIATAAMGVAAWGSYHLAALRFGNTVSTAIGILCAVAVYAFLVVWLRLLSREELKLMPKGEKIADLLRLP